MDFLALLFLHLLIFTARRYAQARSLLWPGVCLSRSYILSRRLKISPNFFVRPVGPSSSFFFDPRRQYPIPRGTPSAGAQNTTGVGKFCDVRLKSPTIAETVRDRPWLLWNVNRKSHALYRIVTFSMTFTDH